ncbi:MAG: lipid-transfer protein [Actinobacteria bacterium]|nr:lipid-transfer protein [Actinomycetota bacterium]
MTHRAVAASGLDRADIDVTMSGSSDFLDGRSFGFVFGLEAVGAWPPIHESHVEQDGAWAAWYAWLKLRSGEADTALVFSWGKTSEGSRHHVLNAQLDPLTLAPLGLDGVASAALQADAWMARTGAGIGALDDAAERAREHAARNPRLRGVTATSQPDVEVASPLGARHIAPAVDGACAIVLAVADVANELTDRPAWIAGADHRSETGALGHRDLSRLDAATTAAATARARAGWGGDGQPTDVAELSAPFAHQVPMLVEALGLDARSTIDPSGGALAADAMMVSGLARLAEAVEQVRDNAGPTQVERVRRAVAHASAGHALQQHVVWCLEAGAS